MKTLKRFFSKPVLWSFVIFILIEFSLYKILKAESADAKIIAASISGIIAVYGYFLTHFLETIRKKEENQFEQYRALIKATRIFINDKGYEIMDLKKQREEFHNAHFDSTLLISSKAYNKFREMITEYRKLLKGEETDYSKFRVARKDFINELRKEFKPFDRIDFDAEPIDLKP